jgi:hypothetical protein
MTDEPKEKSKRGNPKMIPGSGMAGPGRPKGLPNKTTKLLKDAILEAATLAGGKKGLVGYLTMQAVKNPGPFMTLLGKVLPTQLTGANGGPLQLVDLSRHLSKLSDAELTALESAATALATGEPDAADDPRGEAEAG